MSGGEKRGWGEDRSGGRYEEIPQVLFPEMREKLDFSTAYPEILLLYGTRSGNSRIVAAEMARTLEYVGFTVELVDMAGAGPEVIGRFNQLILCSSTHGEGELPRGPKAFHDALAALQPDLDHVAYGIVALGDRNYVNFAAAATHWQNVLDACGAIRVVEPHRIDQGPTRAQLADASRWALACAAAFSEAFSDAD
jgi:MioC protein